jgi:glutamate-5-semialdehyde dehydrogenase
MAEGLVNAVPALLAANAQDIERAQTAGAGEAVLDRLRLDPSRIEAMSRALRDVAALPNRLGQIESMSERPNGLMVGRMRIPLGLIAIIYEARPNVTSDAAGLCIKTGNAVILKGGSQAQRSNEAIVAVLQEALSRCGLPPYAVQLLSFERREELEALLQLEDLIDLVIPRGGEDLIRFVASHSRIPVIKHYKGVCHVYIDESADADMAEAICENAKVQRPSVCNAMETLLVHAHEAPALLPRIAARLVSRGVRLHACADSLALLQAAGIAAEPATDADWAAEYLTLDLAVRVVAGMEEAIEHIRRYGSAHTEAIVTRDHERAMAFLRRVDSSCVLINASTRFNDGGQLGLGAEIGISTTKLHAFGPMGLDELTTRKFVVLGTGQVRTT